MTVWSKTIVAVAETLLKKKCNTKLRYHQVRSFLALVVLVSQMEDPCREGHILQNRDRHQVIGTNKPQPFWQIAQHLSQKYCLDNFVVELELIFTLVQWLETFPYHRFSKTLLVSWNYVFLLTAHVVHLWLDLSTPRHTALPPLEASDHNLAQL